MKTDTIADQVIRGSQNIDRMRNETEQLVRMILGLVGHDTEPSELRAGSYRLFVAKNCVWQIKEVKRRASGSIEYSVCCISAGKIIYSTSYGLSFTPSDMAQIVHENLSVFVEGMMTVFPGLRDKLRPFIMAAEAF